MNVDSIRNGTVIDHITAGCAMKLYLDGFSYKQIAEKMNITPKSADNALSRARKKLRQLL